MKAAILGTFLCLLLNNYSANAWYAKDSLRIFKEEAPLKIIITTNLKKLLADKAKSLAQPAFIQVQFPDSSLIAENITLNARGIYRKKHCYIPSLKLHFKTTDSSRLKKLKDLKLVCPCDNTDDGEQLLLKEYLVYKIYNLVTDKSFRVRLVMMTFTDSEGKKKPITQYTFLVEDIDALADRNKCKEVNIEKLPTENTNRAHTTLVNIFQFMIGNTDWAVPMNHNIKLITNKKPPVEKPYIIPYDFDFAGIVDAYYATPAPELGIVSVRERVYRGFGRRIDEIEPVVTMLQDKKDTIFQLINNFTPLTVVNKKRMISYLEGYYQLTSTRANIKYEFIDNARTE